MNKDHQVHYEASNFFVLVTLFAFSIPAVLTAYFFINIYNEVPMHKGRGAALVIFGFIFLVLLVFCILMLLVALKKKPSLKLDDNGITYSGFKSQVGQSQLPWDAILEVDIKRLLGSFRVISLQLSEEADDFVEKLPKSHQLFFGNSAIVSVEFLAGNKMEICSQISRFIHNKRMQSDQQTATRFADR